MTVIWNAIFLYTVKLHDRAAGVFSTAAWELGWLTWESEVHSGFVWERRLSESAGCLRTQACRCSRFRREATGVLACFAMKDVSWCACTLVAVTEGDVQYHRPLYFPHFILRVSRKLVWEKYGFHEGWWELSWQKYFPLPRGLLRLIWTLEITILIFLHANIGCDRFLASEKSFERQNVLYLWFLHTSENETPH